jgi:hypothetical protein
LRMMSRSQRGGESEETHNDIFQPFRIWH